MLNKKDILILVPLAVLFNISLVEARLNSFSSGITTGYRYVETHYDRALTREEDQIRNEFRIGPVFLLESSSPLDQLLISYNPTYIYDFKGNRDYLNHDAYLGCFREFTSRFRIDLSDQFIASDDPNLITSDNISNYNSSHKRYWTNYFNIKSRYKYNLASEFGAGYTYEILRNNDTGFYGYEDYDKHIADVFLEHHINASWDMAASASYTRGIFDPPDQRIVDGIVTGLELLSDGITDDVETNKLSNDLSEYRASASLFWSASATKTLHVTYSYSASNYDALLRHNTNLHNLTFGAEYQYSPYLSFALGGGPSYEKTESFDDRWDYNAFFNFDYQIAQHTFFSGSIAKGYDQENFSSNNSQLGRDQGLTSFWEYRLDFTHQLWRDLNFNLFVSYRDEHQENLLHGIVNSVEGEVDIQSLDREELREESVFNRDSYRAGSSLSYTFLEYWSSAVSYFYRRQNSGLINDSYEEHQVYLTLSVQKEIIRW